MMLNKRDFDTAKYFLTDTQDSEEFLMLLKAKMDVVKVKQLRLTTIYPAYTHENIGIVAFDLDTVNEYTGKPETISEFAMRFFIKEKNQWKLANPSDLREMDKELLEVMLDEYKDYLKEYLRLPKSNPQKVRDVSGYDLGSTMRN